MQKCKCIALIGLICLQLCGCSQSRQVENQAYVLVMGMDRSAEGGLEISTLIPKISGSGAEAATTGGQGSQGNYLQISVTADNYESALEKLNWAVPRSLNLAQMKMIVLSRNLVENGSIKGLIEKVARTERLFTAAQVVVCDGDAKAFLESMRPAVGTRLSTDIDATMDHYIRFGMIPDSTLANLFYLTQSVYSDPMAAFALLEKKKADDEWENKAAKPASALSASAAEVSDSYESDIETRYLGAALFSDGEFRGVLNGSQTVLANLLNNSLETFRYTCGDECLEFSPVGRTKIKVDTDVQPVKIALEIDLAVSNQDEPLDSEKLNRIFQHDILDLIHTVQQIGIEPFGFAEYAAKRFPTLNSWKKFNWMEQFRNAQVEIEMDFQQLNA